VLHAGEQTELRESRAAALRLGLTLQYVPVRSAGDFPAAFEAIARERAQAIVAFPDVLIRAPGRRTFPSSSPPSSSWS
jgi:hypothetical protein